LEEETILLVGIEAERWAEAQGFERLQEDELIVPSAVKAWKHVVQEGGSSNWAGGTVGAVARDAHGDLAAATSTGGTMGKLPGRVGDSPLIGVGTYADELCAVSATGTGEAFMRAVFAARVADRIRRGEEPAGAIQNVLNRIERELGGAGGAISIPVEGDYAAIKSTTTMSHGWWSPGDSGGDC
jgi:beta-aspartyl-peptidase (threonine type)